MKIKKYLCGILVLTALLFTTSIQAKEVKKNVTILKGDKTVVDMDSTDVENFKISDINVIDAKAKDFKVKISGKKIGTSKITFSISDIDKNYTINVKVVNLKDIKKTANKVIKKRLKKVNAGKKYMLVDLNKDGIKELCLNNKVIYYDYKIGKLQTKKYDLKEIYVSNKNNNLLVVHNKPRSTKEFIYASTIYKIDKSGIFKLQDTGKGFRQYTEKGLEVYGVDKPYAFYDNNYDQDDYEYEAYNKKEMKKLMKKYIPKYKKLVWKKKK